MESQNIQQQPFAASPTPGANPPPGGAASATVHKRTYQACMPCRRRKVRCDLGSVDEPGDPPCQRCRREKKECVFSETRRKRRTSEDGSDLTDEYIARNKRSAGAAGFTDGDDTMQGDSNETTAHDLVHAQIHDPPKPTFPKRPDKAASNREVANETAAVLFQRPIVQPADAFSTLVTAASEMAQQTERKDSKSSTDREKLRENQVHRLSTSGTRPSDLQSIIDPAIMAMQDAAADADVTAALQAWKRLRLVQAGLFTAQEAIAYIDYFYEHLAPLTPVSPPDFSDYAEHPRLLADEPMLTITLLTIASRYKKLEGPGGTTRSATVHDRLWVYLQDMITRMFWGQEQFGGGFCGAGASKTLEEMEAKRRGLRSLGTAESLLLLSDWLPRSLHFPPNNSDGEILVPLPTPIDEEPAQSVNVHVAWTEPAIRSDRMCWSLIGMAYTLSWELGVFDSLLETGVWCPGPQAKTMYDGERADRISRMLLVYVSQACGRLGYPNMMPSQGNETNFNFLKMDIPQGTYPGPYGTITETDKIQRAWAELTALMRQSNSEMFESKARVHEAIQNASYYKFLEDWGPRMREWKSKFDQTDMPEKAKWILRMEFEYTKTYIYSMSLQAVVESMAAGNGEADGNNTSTGDHTPPALFPSKVVEVHTKNRIYIEELIASAREVLRIATKKLQPGGALRHAPVRTHFRILSAAMFLLKSFAIGGKESEVSLSLQLLEDAIKALRTSVIDDVHLSLRIADLLDGLAKGISQKFQRLTIPSRNPNKRPQHAHRTSASLPNPTSAPNSGLANDRRLSANPRMSTSQAPPAGQNGAATPPSSYASGTHYNYEPFGIDEAPLVNLKDPNIKFMPPPDPSFGGTDLYNPGPLSPHSSHAGAGGTGLGSPPISSTLGTKRPRNASFDAPNQMAFSPTHAAFSPMSTSSGAGYDWLALDFNPVLASNGALHFGGPGEQGGHPGQAQGHSHNSTTGGGQGLHEAGGHQGVGHGDEEAQGNVGASPWTMGAFGPEISEGLEMLGALGALVWDDQGQGQGQGGGQWQ